MQFQNIFNIVHVFLHIDRYIERKRDREVTCTVDSHSHAKKTSVKSSAWNLKLTPPNQLIWIWKMSLRYYFIVYTIQEFYHDVLLLKIKYSYRCLFYILFIFWSCIRSYIRTLCFTDRLCSTQRIKCLWFNFQE